ncbi:14547_t:CDS:2 [Funneliformis caledonium]|uniref:14547_t:CDS:1 n=1 Tax=Funneliformis caledonium TaxID=1117310 RepID=A0A9N9ESL3_9GLOM|nr:14547_t:CDS:2 [Funneliformis caledonium]
MKNDCEETNEECEERLVLSEVTNEELEGCLIVEEEARRAHVRKKYLLRRAKEILNQLTIRLSQRKSSTIR